MQGTYWFRKVMLMSRHMSAKRLVTASCFIVISLTANAVPELLKASPQFNFSHIEPMSNSTNAMEIANIGDTPLEIHRVRACCGAKASVSATKIEPGESATLTVSLGPMAKPGPFRKKVTLYTNDPSAPVVEIPIVGEVAEAKVVEQGGDVVIQSASPTPPAEAGVSLPGVADETTAEPSPTSARLSLRLPVILLAGLVDGFNPCAFSIIIVLAGILAVGGRLRKARLWGGIAFCAASYATYMAMGLGLVAAIRAASGFGLVVDVVFGALAVSLFVLSLLSFRDALNYHRKRVPAAITLQLPDKVKEAIRYVAKSSWRGPAVVGTGLVCGVLVTFLDSLCTGQVYVPVLALLAKEQHSVRALALLAIYNLAFIAPLVAVFVLAAKGADSERMSRWSKRNVVPSKIFLGIVFAVLGYLLWPDFAKYRTAPAEEKVSTGLTRFSGFKSTDNNPVNLVNPVQKDTTPQHNRMSADELASGNERLNALAMKSDPSDEELAEIVATIRDATRDPNWRNYCLQIVPELIANVGADSERADSLWDALEYGLLARDTVMPGTALLGLDRLNENGLLPDSDVINFILVVASDETTPPGNRVTALRLGAERNLADILPIARRLAREGKSEYLRAAADLVLRDFGDKSHM